ncbi:MAG: metallophosphoesterase [Opitutaceae bacterium]|nr:metallophosphoesterase [Opitutaceae bacterium]
MGDATPHRSEVLPGVWLDSRRAVFFASLRLLVVADIHWGYTLSHRAVGNLLPHWGDAEIAAQLRALLWDYRPAEMLWLGDSLHALPGRRAAEEFLSSLDSTVLVTVLAGNHDFRWNRAQRGSLERWPYFFHHGDAVHTVPTGAVEIVGHHHPAFRWSDSAGARIKLPALVVSPHRLILPAFSPWAAGVAWSERLREGETLWLIGRRRVFRALNVGEEPISPGS